MTNFADRLFQSSSDHKSVIVAGFDPQLEALPPFVLAEAAKRSRTDQDTAYEALVTFHGEALKALQHGVAAVKPNIAFFEQYGVAGLRAFSSICAMIRDAGLPVIADVKRGDIGTTAKAYAKAFLTGTTVGKTLLNDFVADAITVSPFLGFDTVEVFVEECLAHERGIFILVKTSNPGSAAIQGVADARSLTTVSEQVAEWITQRGAPLTGSCGFSGLGAVVGATYPEEAKALRDRMPNSYLLIPGMGAQGGSARDALAGFAERTGPSGERQLLGGVINISRGLLGAFGADVTDYAKLRAEVARRLASFNAQVEQSREAQ